MSEQVLAEHGPRSGDANITVLQSQEHFDALVSGVEDYAIFLLSTEGNVISWNTGAQRIKGYKAEEIIGKHFSIFYPPEALQRNWPSHVLSIAVKNGKFAEEGWRVRKDGTQFWGNVLITTLRTENGLLRGFLKITRDLSERRKIEALQEADLQKDRFLAILSHDLRTPLAAISGWVNLMRELPEDKAILSQGLEVVQRNAAALAELVADLLDISKIASGTLTTNFEEVDFSHLVSSSVQALSVQATDKGIALKTVLEIPEEMTCRVWGDEVRLQQILANILSNALKFTPEGGAVTVYLRKAQARAILVVKDTGIGISPAFLPRIFERFVQAESSPERNQGMGLGLAICRHLVALHNGSISVESNGPGRGTTFTVKLPLMESKASLGFELLGERTFTEQMGMPDSRLENIKVVAVDDDPDTRDLLKAILERGGAEATVVSSGQEALEAIKTVRPDVLLSDLAMPKMDGYELLEKIRSLEQEVGWLPSIAFTASARSEDRLRSWRAGFQAHIAKPVNSNELVTTIVELVKPKAR
jgi:PAS domain S-box-containing protein